MATLKKKTKKSPKKKIVKKKSKTLKRVQKSKKKRPRALDLRRSLHNPVIDPTPGSYWESEAVFNPGAVIHGGRVHLFYRALGPDGISRVGYASSEDGIHFDKRYPYPVYMPETVTESAKHRPYTSPARLAYDTGLYVSGGGWGGCEDPRAVKIDGRVYLTFNIFNGWHSIRVGLTSISESDLEQGRWNWRRFVFLSPPNERHKNWVLFPEKVNGKYALLHNLYDNDPARVRVEYLDDLEEYIPYFDSPDPHLLPDRELAWHNRTRSVGPPPIKTRYGWLLFYHAMDKSDPGRYKLGAMLLDSKDPRKILFRSRYPVLEPDEWYENDWKPGIIYASGAAIKGGTLFIYYGGGDKHIGVAYANLDEFVRKLMKNEHAVLSVKSAKVA
ncbi:MAG: Glycosidase-related protein [Microgenomates group bacterium GW2011_GWA1_Microgenomates_45_10]|nr:MAG: Glycosidase-related protein [Microgenomates group bacterium GW2011_GWA1_Microgenomates_45_10]